MSDNPELNFEDVRSNTDLVSLGVELERRYPELELGILAVMSRYVETQRGPNDIDNAVNGFRSLVMSGVNHVETIEQEVQPHHSLLTPSTYKRLERQGVLPDHRVDVSRSSKPDYGIIGRMLARIN